MYVELCSIQKGLCNSIKFAIVRTSLKLFAIYVAHRSKQFIRDGNTTFATNIPYVTIFEFAIKKQNCAIAYSTAKY